MEYYFKYRFVSDCKIMLLAIISLSMVLVGSYVSIVFGAEKNNFIVLGLGWALMLAALPLAYVADRWIG